MLLDDKSIDRMNGRARASGLSGAMKRLGGLSTTAGGIGTIHRPFGGTSRRTCIQKVCRVGPEDERMSELNKREAELWDRQVELYTSMSKNASTMYEGLQEAYNDLREFHMEEKKMWLEREESLAKENQELRNTLMYVMSRMRGLEASEENWIDGTAASGGIPEQTSMDEEDVRPSSSSRIQDDFAAAFAAVENGDILKDDPLSFRGRVDDTDASGMSDQEDVSDAEAPVIPTGPPPTLTVGDDDIYWVNQLHVALVDAGFYPGDEDIDDIIFGESTQSALLTFQACSRIPESGMADAATWVELLGEDLEHKESRDLTEDMNPLTESKTSQKPFAELFSSETVQVNVTHGSTTSSVKETHSHDEKIFEDGHVEIEDTNSVEIQEETLTRTEWPVLLEGDGGKEVHALHVLLENAGYWPGEDDLQWWQYGDSTVAAIKTCQACNGLPESGACDETMWQLLLGQNASPSDIDSIRSGNSDDEDLAVDGMDTRVWLIGEQRWEDRSRIAE